VLFMTSLRECQCGSECDYAQRPDECFHESFD
jgi:hypothetical protein